MYYPSRRDWESVVGFLGAEIHKSQWKLANRETVADFGIGF